MLTDKEIIHIVRAYEKKAIGGSDGDIADERAKAYDYYLGKQYGNEKKGRSKVITQDVFEVVEWILPWLVKEFTETDSPIQFDPVGPEDEELSLQVSDYTSYIFFKKNEGFLILYNWFKDALIQKNGYVKVYWEEKEKWTREDYEGLTDDQFYSLLSEYADDEIKIESHSETSEQQQAPDGSVVETRFHDISFRVKEVKKGVIVENVPPEEFRTSCHSRSVDVDQSDYNSHTVAMTLSDLKEEGLSEKKIEEIEHALDEDKAATSPERISRDDKSDYYSSNDSFNTGKKDRANKRVFVNECYVKIDVDEDGISEFWKIRRVGDVLIDKEEIEYNPFCSITTNIIPHKHFGLSIYDIIGDLQLEHSAFKRMIYDYCYGVSDPTTVINDNVTEDDVIDKKPGGYIKTSGIPMNDVMSLIPPPLPPDIWQVDAKIEKTREIRTGVSENFMGSNQGLRGDTAHGVERLMSAMEQKIALIARIVAEVGIKKLWQKIHKLTLIHQDSASVVKLRNKWVNVNPSEWKDRSDLSINVGIGAGDKNKKLASLNTIYVMQKEMAPMFPDSITDQEFHNTFSEIAKNSGLANPDKFFKNPATPEVMQSKKQRQQAAAQQPDPQMLLLQLEQAKLKGDQEKSVIDTSIKMQELKLKRKQHRDSVALDLTKMEQEAQAQLNKEYNDNQEKDTDNDTARQSV